MTAPLEAVREARELRDVADHEFRRAIVKAHAAGHSLRELAQAAGLAKSSVRHYLPTPERRDET